MPDRSSIGQFLSNLYQRFASYFASWLLDTGRGYVETIAAVEEKFPALRVDQAAFATQHGLEMTQAGFGFEKLGYDRRIPLSRIPVNPDLDVGFRYVTVVELTDPETGQNVYRTIVIDSEVNLTRSELNGAVQDIMSALIQQDKYIIFRLQFSAEWSSIDHFQSIERRG